MSNRLLEAIKVTNLSFDEYRNQAVIEVDDGEFFDALDEEFGIEPRTDSVVQKTEFSRGTTLESR